MAVVRTSGRSLIASAYVAARMASGTTSTSNGMRRQRRRRHTASYVAPRWSSDRSRSAALRWRSPKRSSASAIATKSAAPPAQATQKSAASEMSHMLPVDAIRPGPGVATGAGPIRRRGAAGLVVSGATELILSRWYR